MYKAFLRSSAGLFRTSYPYSSAGRRQMQTLVSSDWLSERYKTAHIRVVHAALKYDDFTSHIPGAACFDVSVCRDTASLYPNMLPSPEQFEEYVNNVLYVSNDDHVIVYDGNADCPSLMPGARVWFMFKLFGHDKVSLLNGGLFKWLDEGRPISRQFSASPSGNRPFKARFRPNLVASYEDVLQNIESGQNQLLDARGVPAFKGQEGNSSGRVGHVPKAVNIPFMNLIDPETKLIHDEVKVRMIFEGAKVNLFKPIINSCGSGMTACALLLAENLCGKYDGKLYDGSWSEWSQRADDNKIITEENNN